MTDLRTLLASLGLALLLVPCSQAQSIPFDMDVWTIEAEEHRIETYKGHPSLYLQGGTATLAEATFTDGVIEFDIAFPEARAFTGVYWRRQDDMNFEYFYFRPHQSGNPDANQYTPEFNGLSGWQLYYGARYAVPTEYRFDEWIHTKIVVSGTEAEVYIDDMDTPALFIPELKRAVVAGGIGVLASNLAPARFANFSYTRQTRPTLKGAAPPMPEIPAGSITSWSVSDVFPESDLTGATRLPEAVEAGRTWTTLAVEDAGVANLARVHGIDAGHNTVFARAVVTSNRAHVRKLSIGYSDRARVYLNGHLLYSGDNGYMSRDYRYLGTIGLFDDVYLPLVQGANELWIAVTESFGGWGVKARFEETTGLTISLP